MNTLTQRYRTSLSLLTDLYQLTMAYGYWKTGRHNEEAVFHWFYRKNPFKGKWGIVCGLQDVIEYLQNFSFTADDVHYLGSLKGADGKHLFDEGFLNYLQRMEFNCDIDAVPEGTIVFPHEPLIRVKGPLIQAQLIETALLNIMNFQTLIASKASRITRAAGKDIVLEFGLRRAQGIDGGLSASRAAYIGGCHATSNVLAGRLYGIPVKGTHAHSWVMGFEQEKESFEAYANAMPNNCIFLVDTYDTLEGVKNAIEVGKQLREQGQRLLGIRLDSGDLADLSKKARVLLDEAGFEDTQIVASDSLDEYKIAQLKAKGAKITVWGVGTRLVTANEQPALGGVYKLAAIRKPDEEWSYKVKLSENPIKVSNPGVLQVRRYYMSNHLPFGDMIWNEAAGKPSGEIKSFDGREVVSKGRSYQELLKPIFRAGKCVYKSPHIKDIRAKTLEQVQLFSQVNFEYYPIGLEKGLQEAKDELITKIRQS